MDHKQRHFILDLMSDSVDNLKDNQDPFLVCLNFINKLGQLISEDMDHEFDSLTSRCESINEVSELSI